MNDYDDWYDVDGRPAPYRRPSVSAWIAAVAVAIAVFVLGGYIKTYRLYESFKVEAEAELQKVRAELTEGRAMLATRETTKTGTPAPTSKSPASSSVKSIPPALGVRPEPVKPPTEPAIPSASDQSGETSSQRRPTVTADSGLSSLFIGVRKKQSNAGTLLKLQVIAVDNEQKQVLIEGGLDRAFAEGERLELMRNGRWFGDLRVIKVLDIMSACEVLMSTSIPEPGDLVRLPVGS
ncbi:MAG: hypothetical protein LBJ46_11825 [Planctomycetota bacterium]|jgi:hypothetical protein|nr:hypothetical protein [Planctomycetota bacterium]